MKTFTKVVLIGAGVVTGYYVMKIAIAAGKIENSLGQKWDAKTENIKPSFDSLGGAEGWVKFPRNHVFETPAMIHFPDNLTLYANGSTIKAAPNANLSIVPGVITNANQDSGTNIHIHDLTIDGNCMEQAVPWTQYNNDPVACRAPHNPPGEPWYNYLWSPYAGAHYQEGETACLAGKRYIVRNIYTPPSVYLAWVFLEDAPGCPDDLPGHCVNHHHYNDMNCAWFHNLFNSSFTKCKFINAVSAGLRMWNDWDKSDDGNILIDECEFAHAGKWLEGTGTIDPSHYGCYPGCNGVQILNSTSHDNYGGGFAIENSEYAERHNHLAYPKNWLVSNCRAWKNFSGFWFEQCGPGIIQDCEAWDMHKSEAYADFTATGFVVGSSAFGIRHIRCKAHDCKWRGFSGNGWRDISYEFCEAYDIDSNGPYAGGGIMIGGYKDPLITDPEPVGDMSVLDCDIHDIHGTGTAPRYGRGIMIYGEINGYNPVILRNIVNGCPHDGIMVRGPPDNPSGEVAYNKVSNYGGDCVDVEPNININVHDNTCD